MITTTQNKQIKQIIKLKKSARERRKQELFLVEGIRMFTEIPEEYLYKVYASEDFYNEHRVIFEHMDVELVSPQVMKEISDTTVLNKYNLVENYLLGNGYLAVSWLFTDHLFGSTYGN